jgi:dihydrofolate reductase
MRELILKMSVSIDGFAGGPNGELDWMFPTSDPEASAWTVAKISDVGLHIMGSRTYQDMAAHWPYSTEPFAAPMNDIPKLIFSRRGAVALHEELTTRALADARKSSARTVAPDAERKRRAWEHAPVASGDLVAEITALKAQAGKPVLAHGGVGFVQSLAATGLIDELQLMTHPALLGRGLAPFATLPAPLQLELVETRRFPAGAVASVYRKK